MFFLQPTVRTATNRHVAIGQFLPAIWALPVARLVRDRREFRLASLGLPAPARSHGVGGCGCRVEAGSARRHTRPDQISQSLNSRSMTIPTLTLAFIPFVRNGVHGKVHPQQRIHDFPRPAPGNPGEGRGDSGRVGREVEADPVVREQVRARRNAAGRSATARHLRRSRDDFASFCRRVGSAACPSAKVRMIEGWPAKSPAAALRARRDNDSLHDVHGCVPLASGTTTGSSANVRQSYPMSSTEFDPGRHLLAVGVDKSIHTRVYAALLAVLREAHRGLGDPGGVGPAARPETVVRQQGGSRRLPARPDPIADDVRGAGDDAVRLRRRTRRAAPPARTKGATGVTGRPPKRPQAHRDDAVARDHEVGR